jgi:glyoxylase-like metal-dependent hydrolase (beta-lactamase superfamily II)
MTPRIHQIKDFGVNIFLIAEPDGLTLIDTGTPQSLKAIRRTLDAHSHRPQDLKRILITHTDPDHTGSAAALKALSGARLYASEQEAAAMQRGELSRPIGGGKLTQALLGLFISVVKLPPATADDLLDDGEELPVLGGLRVLATPGHTPGHTSLFAPQHGVLFAGDSMRATKDGLRCDDAPVMWDYRLARESAERQMALGPQMVCCGHGPVLQGDAVRLLDV